MADTGFVFPGTAIGDRAITSAVNAWGVPDRIKLDNASYADNTSTGIDELSYGLAASNFDFTSIPSGATIYGIEVKVGDYKLVSSSHDFDWTTVKLILADDSDGSVNRFADFTDWTDTDQTDGSGNSSDLWSETITRTDVTDADWGFFIGIKNVLAGTSSANVDFMQMKVYYSTSPVITDVNTTESWTDGDTGLVITGTLFV